MSANVIFDYLPEISALRDADAIMRTEGYGRDSAKQIYAHEFNSGLYNVADSRRVSIDPRAVSAIAETKSPYVTELVISEGSAVKSFHVIGTFTSVRDDFKRAAEQTNVREIASADPETFFYSPGIEYNKTYEKEIDDRFPDYRGGIVSDHFAKTVQQRAWRKNFTPA